MNTLAGPHLLILFVVCVVLFLMPFAALATFDTFHAFPSLLLSLRLLTGKLFLFFVFAAFAILLIVLLLFRLPLRLPLLLFLLLFLLAMPSLFFCVS